MTTRVSHTTHTSTPRTRRASVTRQRTVTIDYSPTRALYHSMLEHLEVSAEKLLLMLNQQEPAGAVDVLPSGTVLVRVPEGCCRLTPRATEQLSLTYQRLGGALTFPGCATLFPLFSIASR